LVEKELLKLYFSYHINILSNVDVFDKILDSKNLIIDADRRGNKIVFAGNGASAAIASHASLDFKKQAKIRTLCFNEPSFITAYSNDYGYENWLMKAIEHYCNKGDIAVLISSSGKSKNIVNAARYAKKINMKVITFSGFSEYNPLKQLGDINFWVDCKAYNVIENVHQIWLMGICDLIIGKLEYSVG